MSIIFWQEGSWFWLRDAEFYWIPVQVSKLTRDTILFTTSFKSNINRNGLLYAQKDLKREIIYPIADSSLDGVEDMSNVTDLHESALLHNLELRYRRDQIYTSIGSILCAINPYKLIDGLYGNETISNYKGHKLGERPPHVYALANEAYAALWRKNQNQCILISGESGAGKTESTKFILNFLTVMSHEAGSGGNSTKVEDAILHSSPILEAFGNAKTIYNDNSSRFGKYIHLQFTADTGHMVAGSIIDYLLEKNRVVKQNHGERNFHIFYEFLSGLNEGSREKYSIGSLTWQDFYYTNQGRDYTPLESNSNLQTVLDALKTLHIPKAEIEDMLGVLASILHLGNLRFVTSGGAQVENQELLSIIANLLSLPEKDLSGSLTHKYRILRGEEILTPLTVLQAEDSRDSVAMALYYTVFKWINTRINQRITRRGVQAHSKNLSIGVLDIFGFECFTENHFEQFNINYANEKLQQYFNKHIFSLEQHEYTKEGIPWQDIEWQDNSECLDLIEQRLGIMALMNEESNLPNGQDETLLDKLHTTHLLNLFYIKPKVNNSQFGIRHYAGEVIYQISEMVEKNRDLFRDDLIKMLKSSGSEFIYYLFQNYGMESRAGLGKKQSFRQAARVAVNKVGGPKPRHTVSSHFKDSLQALMGSLNSANPYFVRCIKPNNNKTSDSFDHKTVLNQLRYSGMMETVRIRRAGYPVRRLQKSFLERYHVLAKVFNDKQQLSYDEPTPAINQLLLEYDPLKVSWQTGVTKVFLKESLECKLETEREIAYNAYINIIASCIYTIVLRKRFLAYKKAAVCIQKYTRRRIAVRRFKEMKQSSIVIQKWLRGYLARKLFKRLVEEHRIQQELIRRQQKEKEQARLKELARLELENKRSQAALLKKQLEEEVTRRQLARIEEERSTQEAIVRYQELQEKEKRKSKAISNPEDMPPPPQHECTPGMLTPGDMVKTNSTHRGSKVYPDSVCSISSSMTEEELQRAEQEALTHILDLDKCLKDEESRSNGYIDITPSSSFEYESEFEERERFAAIQRALGVPGSDLYSLSMEGYLSLRGGKANVWRKYWCVLREQTFMYYKSKQDAIKQGWLNKRSLGRKNTLSKRTNLKRRFVVLRGSHLSYYESDETGSKALNTIDIKSCTMVSDEGNRNNAFSVTNVDKTYYFYADRPEIKREWMDLLCRLKYMSEAQLEDLQQGVEADPRNAVGTLDLDLIDDVSVTKQSNKLNSFAVIMAHRVMILSADKPEDMNKWVSALKPKHRPQIAQGPEILHKGYLIKEFEGKGANNSSGSSSISSNNSNSQRAREKCFYILTREGLSYYQSEDSWMLGQIFLDNLCSLILPNSSEAIALEEERWTFILNTKKKSYLFSARSERDYQEWVCSINDVIIMKPSIETPTEKLINFIVEGRVPKRFQFLDEVYQMYSKILCHQKIPIKSPLLALPYGKPILLSTKSREYYSLQDEAISVFNILINHEALSDPIAVSQNLTNTCYDVEDLRSEMFCQLIKQTSGVGIDALPVLRCWQILCCMCWCFVPERAIFKYVSIHLRRSIEKYPDTELQKFAEFAFDGLNQVIPREFPPSKDEISALISRRQMKVVIHCYSGGTCDITINSITTAGEVVRRLCMGMNISQANNRFALFDVCADSCKFISHRVIVADIVSKHERLARDETDNHKFSQRRLFFKILCTINPTDVPFDSTEFALMLEQAHENVIKGFFPASQKTLIKLAALHLQFTRGNFEFGNVIQDITKEYPLVKVKEDSSEHRESASIFNRNTLKKDSLKRYKSINIDDMLANEMEMQSVKGQVTDYWRKSRGVSDEEAMKEYMEILKEWPGFGSTFFNIQYTDDEERFPRNLWLGLHVRGLQLYKQGEARLLAEYPYNLISNYEAQGQNYIKLDFIGATESVKFETSKVIEIIKILNSFTALVQMKAAYASPMPYEVL